MTGVSNSKLSIDFLDLDPNDPRSSPGITLLSISDVATGREYLSTCQSMLFEFSVNNQPYPIPNGISHTTLSVYSVTASPDGSSLQVSASSTDPTDQISFDLLVTLASDSPVAILQMTANNMSQSTIFLRAVLPKIFRIQTPMMGAISKEAGDVILLSHGHHVEAYERLARRILEHNV